MIAAGVYFLCAVASILCAALLIRAHRRTRSRLLFWSAACFVGLGLNNVLLFIDLVVVPDIDLEIVRQACALGGLGLLLFGLVWETR